MCVEMYLCVCVNLVNFFTECVRVRGVSECVFACVCVSYHNVFLSNQEIPVYLIGDTKREPRSLRKCMFVFLISLKYSLLYIKYSLVLQVLLQSFSARGKPRCVSQPHNTTDHKHEHQRGFEVTPSLSTS